MRTLKQSPKASRAISVSSRGNDILQALRNRFGYTSKEVLERLLRDEDARLQVSEGFSVEAFRSGWAEA
jgi:hypothetical protein